MLLDYRISLNDALIDWSQVSIKTRAYLPYDGGMDKLGDLYSFGLLSYQILFGRHPLFRTEDYVKIQTSASAARELAASRIESGQWLYPSRIPPVEITPDMRGRFGARLDPIFERVFGRREQRYEEPLAFASTLEAAIDLNADSSTLDTQPLQPAGMQQRGATFPVPERISRAVEPESPPETLEVGPSQRRAQRTRSVAPVPIDGEESQRIIDDFGLNERNTFPVTIIVAGVILVALIAVTVLIFGAPPNTASPTVTASAAAVNLLPPSETPLPVLVDTQPPSPTALPPTATATWTLTLSPTITATATLTATASHTPTVTPTNIPTNTPLPTLTATPFPTNTPLPFEPSEDLADNLLALRQAIRSNPYDCTVFNRVYDYVQNRLESGGENNADYEQYGQTILDAMTPIYHDYCLLFPQSAGPLPDNYAQINNDLDLKLWDIVLSLRANF